MARRKMLFHPDCVREKIRASQLINRLHKCAFGEISLTITQVRAIEILLRKSIPDLAAAEIKSEQMYRYVVELRPVLSRDEWLRKYGQNPRLDMGSGGDRAAGEPAIA
jgi:hypothetical protein